MLRINRITKVFNTDDGRTVRALDDFSLDIRQGELVGLMGPNGSGKSTAFRILDRQYEPDDGSVSWEPDVLTRDNDGRITCVVQCKTSVAENAPAEVAGRQPKAYADAHAMLLKVPHHGRRPPVAHVPQEPRALSFPEMTLEEHLLLAELSGRRARFWARGVTRSRRQRYRAVLEEYGVHPLSEALSRPLRTLSVGWQQIFVILMAALGHVIRGDWRGPALLLLDEPTSALDVQNTRLCLDLVRRLHREGQTIILATHDAELALDVAERLVIMKGGRLVTDLSAAEAVGVGLDGVRRLVVDDGQLAPTSTK